MLRAVSDEDKERRRDEILAAARRVFARAGYHRATMADVAREAGRSYGSVYWYFESKDDLFCALVEEEATALATEVAGALATRPPADDPLAPVRAAVRATFAHFERDHQTVRLLFREPAVLGRRIQEHLAGIAERFLAHIEEVVVAAQRRGAVVDAPPRLVAFTAVTLVSQVAQRRLVTDDGLDAEAAADYVVGVLVEGLGREPARPPRPG